MEVNRVHRFLINTETTCTFHSYKYTVSKDGSNLQAFDSSQVFFFFSLAVLRLAECPARASKGPGVPFCLGKLVYQNMLLKCCTCLWWDCNCGQKEMRCGFSADNVAHTDPECSSVVHLCFSASHSNSTLQLPMPCKLVKAHQAVR